ncbi:MAG: hypothetical protein A2289_05460 [Deltaproteobacteria bacterium RIFOXYA12_FULL_58_15]|nr:MAG: hypothetical protein A2289_05460 [Deltaproteobacteria bacterium RIFOXYA12_FULL_58_15]
MLSYNGDRAISHDGINWETSTDTTMSVPDADYAKPIAHDGLWVSMFVNTESRLSGPGYMASSTNGLDWTFDTSRDVGYWYGGYRLRGRAAGLWVAQRQTADDLLISTNGTTWTETTTGTVDTSSIYLTPSGSSWLTWTWLDDEIYVTTDFSTFTPVTAPFADGVAKQIAYNQVSGRWIASDIDGPMKHSDDLNTWTATGSPFTEYGTTWLVPSETNNSWIGHQWSDIAHSADGSAFGFVNTGLGAEEGIAFVREIGGVWFASGFEKSLHRSADGTHWSTLTNPYDADTVRDIVFVGP